MPITAFAVNGAVYGCGCEGRMNSVKWILSNRYGSMRCSVAAAPRCAACGLAFFCTNVNGVSKMRNRRNFLKQAGVGGISLAAWPWVARTGEQSIASQTPDFLSFSTAPSLQNPSATGVTVAVGVNKPCTAWVEYGETEQLGRVATGSRHGLKPYDARAHHVRIEGLRPGQHCFYRVHACAVEFKSAYDIRRGETVTSDIYSFRTFDPAAKETRFVVWNDTHENAETMAKLMIHTAKHSADFHVWNGDVTNDNYTEDKMVEHYLGAGGQPFARETPLLFVRGNHDTRGPAARALPRYQETPNGRFYYGFRHGPVAGVVLDSGEDKPDSTKVYAGLGDFIAYHEEQTAWLRRELEQPYLRDARFRVAFCHIPLWWADKRYPEDQNDPRFRWHELLADAHFCMVISGHTHSTGVFPPNDHRPYAQIIGGGPKPENATLICGVATSEKLAISVLNTEGVELNWYGTFAPD